MVDFALQDLTPQQIVFFIQSFGTPVNSMLRLLSLLALAVIEHTNPVKEAIGNGIYFTQQSRGSKNGHRALQMLQSNDNVLPDQPRCKIVVTKQLKIQSCRPKVQVNSSQSKEIEEVIDLALHSETLTHTLLLPFRRLIQQLITTDGQHHLAKQQQNTVSKEVQCLFSQQSDGRCVYLVSKEPLAHLVFVDRHVKLTGETGTDLKLLAKGQIIFTTAD